MSEDRYALAQEAIVVSAFRNGVAIDDIAAVIGSTHASVERMLEKVGLKGVDQRKPDADADADADEAGAGPAPSCVAGDLAFQNAMYRAIKRGLEKPPMIGVSKNTSPFEFHSHYVAAPLHSGCSSPAEDCAALGAAVD
jgi:hypothetical protein